MNNLTKFDHKLSGTSVLFIFIYSFIFSFLFIYFIVNSNYFIYTLFRQVISLWLW